MKAILCAFLAALFYAVNIPFSKLLLVSVGPTTMAALLYLGAGIGVGIMALFTAGGRKNAVPLSRHDMPFVIGMILLDITAPILLMLGIRMVRRPMRLSSATSKSLPLPWQHFFSSKRQFPFDFGLRSH